MRELSPAPPAGGAGGTRRWREQRWALDAVIRTVGVEWDQHRLAKGSAGGSEGREAFRRAGGRVQRFADITREFGLEARRVEARAEEHAREGHDVSARESWFVAALLWAMAAWPVFERGPELDRCVERMNRCYGEFAQVAGRVVGRVELPFGDSALPGYLHLPPSVSGEPLPCVISIGGMDGNKESMVALYGDKLLERGFAVLAVDGPGQSESASRGVWLTESNHGDAAEAIYEYVAADPRLDAARVVMRCTSFGSYFGTVAAARLGSRLRGFAATGVCHEPGCGTLFEQASPSFKARFMFMSGYADEDAFDAFAPKLDLRPVAGGVSCPYLVLAGEFDQLSPIEWTLDLFERITAPKRLLLFEGGEHGTGGRAADAYGRGKADLVADWLRDRVDDKPVDSALVRIDAAGRATSQPWT